MRSCIAAVLALLAASGSTAEAQTCKVCAEQRKACTKNYAGPACKTEYRMCLKSCKSNRAASQGDARSAAVIFAMFVWEL